METQFDEKKNLYKVLVLFVIVLSVFFIMKFLSEFRSYNMMGSNNINTITLSGYGEVQAVPDIATVYFTIQGSKGTQKESSDEVNTKTKTVLDFLKNSGVMEKDIKTENYNSYPKYSNPVPCPLYYPIDGNMPPCQTESKIIGYTVSQSITVKVREVDNAGKVIDGINKIGVTNMSGPTLAIDDEEGLKMQARKKAIEDSKEKAKVLSKDLGVRLGRIASFSESGGNYYPMMYKGAAMEASDTASVPSVIPKGENTISSNITITYEIR